MLIQSLPHSQDALLFTYAVSVGDYGDVIWLMLSILELLPRFHNDSPLLGWLMYLKLNNHLILLLRWESHSIESSLVWV